MTPKEIKAALPDVKCSAECMHLMQIVSATKSLPRYSYLINHMYHTNTVSRYSVGVKSIRIEGYIHPSDLVVGISAVKHDLRMSVNAENGLLKISFTICIGI